MPLTRDQTKSLLQKAKERNPNLSRDQAKSLIEKANSRFSSQPSSTDAEGIFRDAGLREQPKQTNVSGDKLDELKQYRDLQPTGDFGKDVARGAISSQYRNIEEEPGMMTKGIRAVSGAAPAVASTVSGAVGRLLGRNTGSTAAGAGYGVGQAFGESLENLAGIQDETPQQLAEEAVKKPLEVGATDFALDLGFSKAGDILKGMGKKISKSGVIKSVGNKVDDVIKNDLIAQFNPSKRIRKEARKRGIDIAQDVIGGGYGDDVLANIDLAKKHRKDLSKTLRTMLDKRDIKVDATSLIDDVAAKAKSDARSTAQKNAIDEWSNFMKNDRFAGGQAGLTKLLDEKIAAGMSGYKDNSDVVANLVGQADAKLERKLRSKILDSLPKKGKKQFEKIMKQQESSMFLQRMFEDAADTGKPLTISGIVGRFANPLTTGKETIGRVAEAGVRNFGRQATGISLQTTTPSVLQATTPSVLQGMQQFVPGAAGAATSSLMVDGQGGGGDIMAEEQLGLSPDMSEPSTDPNMRRRPVENKDYNTVASLIGKHGDETMVRDPEIIAYVALVLKEAGIDDRNDKKMDELVKKTLNVIQRKRHEDEEKEVGFLRDIEPSEPQNEGIDTEAVGGYKTQEGIPLYR